MKREDFKSEAEWDDYLDQPICLDNCDPDNLFCRQNTKGLINETY